MRNWLLFGLLLVLLIITGCARTPPVEEDDKGGFVFADQGACEKAGGQWTETPFQTFRCSITDERACAAYGGDWIQQGLIGDMMCVFTYPDGGKQCTSSDECIGGCFVQEEGFDMEGMDMMKGHCKHTDSPFGCHTKLNGPAMCVD